MANNIQKKKIQKTTTQHFNCCKTDCFNIMQRYFTKQTKLLIRLYRKVNKDRQQYFQNLDSNYKQTTKKNHVNYWAIKTVAMAKQQIIKHSLVSIREMQIFIKMFGI